VSAASGTGRLYRSRLDRKLLGICGGLGVYLAVDPTILRLLFVISAIASFGGTLLLYLITAIIIPAEPLAARPA
jgi:phage shock protein PspC (stress-responsive transcriptional regulator)